MTPGTIKAARLVLSMTQRQFAAELNTNDRAVRRWESGEKGISGPAQAAIRLLLEKHGKRIEEHHHDR